jgi:hypothetical protein
MAIDFGIGLQFLQEAGQDATRRLAMDQSQQKQTLETQQLQRRQQIGGQAVGGNYQGAAMSALQAGDLDYAKAIGGLQEQDQKLAGSQGKLLAAIGSRLRTVPQEQRAPMLQQFAPMLRQYGFGDDELASADLSDGGVDNYIAMGKAFLDKTPGQDEPSVIRALDAIGLDRRSPEYQDIVKRSLASPRYLPNGDGTFTVVGGGGSAPQQSPADPSGSARVSDQGAYAQLAPGTPYIAPDGSHRIKGGAASQAPNPFAIR